MHRDLPRPSLRATPKALRYGRGSLLCMTWISSRQRPNRGHDWTRKGVGIGSDLTAKVWSGFRQAHPGRRTAQTRAAPRHRPNAAGSARPGPAWCGCGCRTGCGSGRTGFRRSSVVANGAGGPGKARPLGSSNTAARRNCHEIGTDSTFQALLEVFGPGGPRETGRRPVPPSCSRRARGHQGRFAPRRGDLAFGEAIPDTPRVAHTRGRSALEMVLTVPPATRKYPTETPLLHRTKRERAAT